MKILILYPGKMPKTPEQINCFSDVWSYYLVKELEKNGTIKTLSIPNFDNEKLADWFRTVDVVGYDAVIAMGLRYFSRVPREIGEDLKKRVFPGFLCQIHDGSRLNSDPVDITFTLKNDNEKYPIGAGANRFIRHHSANVYVGWAADPTLNLPNQDPDVLRILVDHTNYGDNQIDRTQEILEQISTFVKSQSWKTQYREVKVRRFDSGGIIDVDFSRIHKITRYDRKSIPFTEICREHGHAHLFFVTHPESVGLVVLETAMAGALTVAPKNFIPQDRLNTVRAVEYQDIIPWDKVLEQIDPTACREKSIVNSWALVCKHICDNLIIRKSIRGAQT